MTIKNGGLMWPVRQKGFIFQSDPGRNWRIWLSYLAGDWMSDSQAEPSWLFVSIISQSLTV
jgi:hypothetical protein